MIEITKNYVTEDTIKIIIGIILSIALASSFIGIFFFTYGKTVENNMIINGIKYMCDNVIGSVLPFLPDGIKNKIKTKLDNVKLDDMSQIDDKVDKSNTVLFNKTLLYLGSLLGVALIITFILSYVYDIDYFILVVKSLIILCGIALVEFIFLFYISKNFIIANPNQVISLVLNAI
jgi:hypothetical protein